MSGAGMGDLIIAPVVLPAVLAGITLLVARDRPQLARALAGAGNAALLVIALVLFGAATGAGPELYRLGDWPAPFGIVLMLDRLSALMLLLTAGLSLAVLAQAALTGWDRRGAHFHALWLFQLMGLNGAFLTADAFNLFVFFEVLLIASYGLMVHGGTGPRIRAGLHYIAVNLVGSTLFLFALATIYSVMGTLNMADLAVKLRVLPEGDVALMRVAAVLLMLVFAVKGALVPLHFWLPGTYAKAPGVVAALFAVMTKVGAYAAIRTGTLIYPPDLPATGPLMGQMLLPAALLTLAVGAVGVLGARSLPRLAAYAAIASMGTTFIAIAGFGTQAIGAALYYMIHSTLAAAFLFLLADVLASRGAIRLEPEQAQKGPRLPGPAAALFLAAAMACAGLPPLSGFIGKLFVLQATTAQAEFVWPVVLGGSFLMILGFARAGSTLFWKASGPAPAHPLGLRDLAVPGLFLGALAALSILAGPVSDWMAVTAGDLVRPEAYIDANRLGEGA
jgi:multicomponent K+:H+ antiporter subunit D